MVLFEALAYSFIWLCEGAYGSGRTSKLFVANAALMLTLEPA